MHGTDTGSVRNDMTVHTRVVVLVPTGTEEHGVAAAECHGHSTTNKKDRLAGRHCELDGNEVGKTLFCFGSAFSRDAIDGVDKGSKVSAVLKA